MEGNTTEGKIYEIFLNDTRVGLTKLENADISLGLLFGEVYWIKIPSPYDFIKDYCVQNQLEFKDNAEDGIISTGHIPLLRIVDKAGLKIDGEEHSLFGADSDVFEISIEGVPMELLKAEFPHHVEEYLGQERE